MTFKLTHSLAGAEVLVHLVICNFADFFSGCPDSLSACAQNHWVFWRCHDGPDVGSQVMVRNRKSLVCKTIVLSSSRPPDRKSLLAGLGTDMVLDKPVDERKRAFFCCFF